MKTYRYPVKKYTFRGGRSLFLEELDNARKRRASERDQKVAELEARLGEAEKDIRRMKKEMGL